MFSEVRFGQHVTDHFGDAVEVKRYTTADDLVLDLTGGRLDLVFLDFPVGKRPFSAMLIIKQSAKIFRLGMVWGGLPQAGH